MATIQHIFHIDASFEEVYNAISTIQGIQNWWTTNTSGEEALNGTILVRFGKNGGMDFKVIENSPSKSYKWKTTDGHPEWIDTEIHFELDENDNKVRVTFTHSGWKEATPFMSQCNFSWARYMISLRNYLEKGQGEPYSE